MTAAEQLFDGAPVAHVAAFYERERMRNIADRCREAKRSWSRASAIREYRM